MNNTPQHVQVQQPQRWQPRIFQAIAGILLIALVGIRFINLDADPPTWFIPSDHGLQVDEGYKMLAPKNLSLYGDTRWHKDDGYTGWFSASPLTQWPYYFAFQAFGASVEIARAVVIAGYALFLVLSWVFMARRYGQKLALVGLALLGIAPGLYHFSRSAIFEATIIAVFYVCLIAWFSVKREHSRVMAILGISLAGGAAAAFVKASALLYVVPAILFMVLLELITKKRIQKSLLLAAPIVIASLGIVIWLARDLWIDKLNLSILPMFWMYFLENPIPQLAPMLMSGATLVILYAVRTNSSWLLTNHWRTLLAGIVIGAPMLLSVFEYQPPRFFVPVIPACIFLILEGLKSLPVADTHTAHRKYPIRIAIEMLLLCCLAMFIMRDLNYSILEFIPVNIGSDPGIDAPMLLKLLPFTALTLIAAYYLLAKYITEKFIKCCLIIFLIISIVPSFMHIERTIRHPEYNIRAIAKTLEATLSPEQSVAGIVAPLFTTDNKVKALYVDSGWLNQAEKFDTLRPTYLLMGDFKSDRETMDYVRKDPNITVGPPTRIGSYFLGPLYLYKLTYRLPAHE